MNIEFNAQSARDLQKSLIKQASNKQVETLINKIKEVCAKSEQPKLRIVSDSINSMTKDWLIDNGFKIDYPRIGTYPPATYTEITW